MEAGEGKNAKFGALHPSGPDFFSVWATFWGPTMTCTKSRNGLAKRQVSPKDSIRLFQFTLLGTFERGVLGEAARVDKWEAKVACRVDDVSSSVTKDEVPQWHAQCCVGGECWQPIVPQAKEEFRRPRGDLPRSVAEKVGTPGKDQVVSAGQVATRQTLCGYQSLSGTSGVWAGL